MCSIILCLETSTKVCSVALGKNGKIIALKESHDEQYTHSENLTLYIEDVIKQAGMNLSDLDAVAVSKGPGSYTGLRIGVSVAKGLCYALNKPLIAVNTLQSLLFSPNLSTHNSFNESISLLHSNQLSTFFCPMLDAKRMDVYYAVYDKNLNEIFPTSIETIDEKFIERIFSIKEKIGKDLNIFFFGDGANKCKSVFYTSPMYRDENRIQFIDDIFPSAKFIIPLAEKSFLEEKFESVAYFEPFYLKDFVAKNFKIQI
ncbi:MAG: tRNA (adenosine(37)-N6)-threonylcarbamoyltransferase complex dimerization subunit type 1 TsaB [Bacteroidota bacterium]